MEQAMKAKGGAKI